MIQTATPAHKTDRKLKRDSVGGGLVVVAVAAAGAQPSVAGGVRGQLCGGAQAPSVGRGCLGHTHRRHQHTYNGLTFSWPRVWPSSARL